MGGEQNRILQLSLESQLEFLKRRLLHPDAAQWRQLGKMTQDFDLWLERARPLMPCASRLISLRINQISERLTPQRTSKRAVHQLLDLLNEAVRHLAHPDSPIQVIDLEKEERPALSRPEYSIDRPPVGLPTEMYELPNWLQPEGDPAVIHRFIIPN